MIYLHIICTRELVCLPVVGWVSQTTNFRPCRVFDTLFYLEYALPAHDKPFRGQIINLRMKVNS